MDIMRILYTLPGILIGFSLHEFAHAKAAVMLGDDTPRYQGRLSISPLVHIDILGFLMLLFAGFGWAKPVQINPNNFKNRRRDEIIVALAGPLTNLALAVFFLALMKATSLIPYDMLRDDLYYIIMDLFDYALWINIVLFVFNLIPIPPLDGHHIIFGLLNLKDHKIYYQLLSKGSIILLILIITDLIDKIMTPPIIFVYKNLVNVFF